MDLLVPVKVDVSNNPRVTPPSDILGGVQAMSGTKLGSRPTEWKMLRLKMCTHNEEGVTRDLSQVRRK